MKKILAAQWIAPMDRPLIRGGAVAIEGERIIDVGDARALRGKHRHAQVEELGQSIILPGLINAHTHLELSHIQREPPPTGGLADWLIRVIKKNMLPQGELEKTVAKGVAIGLKQCLGFGVSTVGDISRNCRLTRSILSRSPLRVVSYGEIQAMGERRILLEDRLAAATDETSSATNVRIGITPHAPYSVEPQGYQRALQVARERNLPLATHLAETQDEALFLATHGGSLRKVWDFVGGYDRDIPTFSGGPIRFAKALGLLDYPTLLAHVNYCDDAELDILAAGKASVVYNPRTHAYFQHPPHRFREMLARGINVTLGTDSTASSGDLNLVEELRVVRRIAPDHPVEEIWQLATIRAARALQIESVAGSITPGKLADLAVFPAHPNPLASILDQPLPLSKLYIGGRITLNAPASPARSSR